MRDRCPLVEAGPLWPSHRHRIDEDPTGGSTFVSPAVFRRILGRNGAVVVCAGGGGVPVVRNDLGRLDGVEADYRGCPSRGTVTRQ